MTRILSPRRLILLSLFVGIPILLFVFRLQVLAGIGNFLVIHDDLEAADVIFVLNGDPTVRPYHAAALFKRKLAPKVVIARTPDSPGVEFGAYPNVTDSNIKILKELGIPGDQITELRDGPGVTSTFDEANAFRDFARKNNIHKAIIVTSDLHSRRTRFVFHRVLRETQVDVLLSPIADRKYGANNWWTLEDGVIGCQNEYIKLLYYHLKY